MCCSTSNTRCKNAGIEARRAMALNCLRAFACRGFLYAAYQISVIPDLEFLRPCEIPEPGNMHMCLFDCEGRGEFRQWIVKLSVQVTGSIIMES